MNGRSSAIEIAVVWADPDLQEVVVSASSEHFSGQVALYARPDELSQLARCFDGFPVSPTDRREFHLGQAGLSGYGTVHLTVFCKDATGHVIIQANLCARPVEAQATTESCVVQVPAVLADVDRFVRDLCSISNQIGASAVLKSVA